MFVHFNQCVKNICLEISVSRILLKYLNGGSQLIESGRAFDRETEGEAAGAPEDSPAQSWIW